MTARLGTFYLGTFYLGEVAADPRPIPTDPPSWLQRPHCTVTVGGVVQDALEWHTDAGLDRISTADVTLAWPAGAEITEGAAVEISATRDESEAEKRVFWGRVNVIEPGIGEGGRVAHLRCAGWAWALTLPLEADLAFAGGAAVTGTLLGSSVIHVGDDTISWYADSTPDGLSYDYTFSPATDARFVRIEGQQHGANSYREEPDRDLTAYSRVEIWQEGRRKGYANLPMSGERYRDELDYSDAINWDEFALTIGARIEADAGDVTVRFTSGRKPGSSERDEYEVKNVTYQIAGRMTARDLFRSILRHRGYGPGGNDIPYRVAPVRDLAGNTVYLGGNGLINNGRIVLTEKAQPHQWMTQVANLWGYRVKDGPDAIEILPARGAPPEQEPVATFTEGVNIFDLTPPHDVGDVVTYWRVYGASGTDENGEPFRYESSSAVADIATPDYLPDPPGLIPGDVRHEVITSDELATSVRQIKEVEYEALPIVANLDAVVPSPEVMPGSVIRVTAPNFGLDDLLWVTDVRHDWDEGGFWTGIAARAATGDANAEAVAASEPREQTSAATRHIGEDDIAWYARSNPDGLAVAYDWHPGGSFRGVRVTGRYHGANSWPSGSKADDPSTVEVWQLGVRLGSASLPWHSERYDRRQDYDDDTYWADFDLMIAADVVDASAEILFVSGTARDGSRDEYEVKGVQVALYAEATEQSSVPNSGADWHAYQPRRVWRRAS